MRRTVTVITAVAALSGACAEAGPQQKPPLEVGATIDDMVRAGMRPEANSEAAESDQEQYQSIVSSKMSQTTQEMVAEGMEGYSGQSSTIQRIGSYPVYTALFLGGKASQLID